jgi:hypothetical protein
MAREGKTNRSMVTVLLAADFDPLTRGRGTVNMRGTRSGLLPAQHTGEVLLQRLQPDVIDGPDLRADWPFLPRLMMPRAQAPAPDRRG